MIDTGSSRPKLIVIVDSVESTRLLLRDIFTAELGAYVTMLNGCDGLIQSLREVRPNLVVVEFDGRRPSDLDVVRAVTSDPFHHGIPFVGLTAWSDVLPCATLLAIGCVKCLVKPFDLNELIEVASALI
jgi:DNA-binding NtrC family response regulator